MDLKEQAAKWGYTFVKDHTNLGLGDGSSVLHLAKAVVQDLKKRDIRIYTSSIKTETFLKQAGVIVSDITSVDTLDQYFDGCDQVDQQLNAFKSGSGIHTSEKLFASMAVEFILLAEESKFVSRLENKYPLVLEVIPPAYPYVTKRMKTAFSDISMERRCSSEKNEPVLTRYGNFLIDCRFQILPDLKMLQFFCKSLTGVVDISLFYQLAHTAIIAGESGIRRLQRKNNEFQMTLHEFS